MDTPRSVVFNTYPPAEVARLLLLVLGFGIGVYVLWRIQEVVFLLVVAILVATAIEPIVDRPRGGLLHVGAEFWSCTRPSRSSLAQQPIS